MGYGNIRGINLKYFDRTVEVEKEAEKIRKTDITTFIFIGRLVRDKGINELVYAFAKLNKEYPKTRLLLVGRREDKLDPLQNQTLREIDNNPAIIATGEQKDVRPWLAASNIFVFPSYREGFPNVVIEAGAMGLPAIVTDINGSREIIIEGENGIIIPPRNSEHLYKAMQQLMVSPKQTRQMANNARPMIESRFEQTFVRKCLKEYYKKILHNV